MERIVRRHKDIWINKQFVRSVIIAIIFYLVSLFINYTAGTYATRLQSNYVNDFFLDNLPVFDVDVIFIQGAIVLWFYVLILLILHPQRIPFVVKSLALFIFVRSFFITLTHLGPYPHLPELETNFIMRAFTFGGDFFFSGHTGGPFLMALIFWGNKLLRTVFLVSSLIFAVTVILGHLHYSIDVFAAFFITYGIFHMALTLFAKDYSLFINGLKNQK